MKDAIETNYQAVYYCQQNSIVVALNIMAFGVKEFRRSYVFENLDVLEKLCERIEKNMPPTQADFELAKGFIINNLIDCIRITICFENFFKSFQ